VTGLRLSLLGSPQLERAGEPLTLGRQRAFALLAYLATTRQTQRRETLTAFLWPDVAPDLAYSYLRRDLSVLHKILGSGWLEIDRYNVAVVTREDFWLDTTEFRNKLEACSDHSHQPDEICLDCITQLSEAVALYRGDFLSGFNLPDSLEFDEWKTIETQDLRTDLIWALNRLTYGFSSQRKFDDAIMHTRRWLRLDPFNEFAHRRLMQLYAWKGNWMAARQHYEELKMLLKEKLQLVPEEATQQLYRLILENKVQEPPLWSAGHATRYVKPRHNLPPQLTPFIGRKKEIAEISRLLRDEPACRMLTLVGPGGIGKTRLAIQAANQLLDEFQNGVFIVSLTSVDSAEHIVPAIAKVLTLSFQGREEPKTQLINYLREKQLLLLLDNFEHLTHGAALLTDMLNGAPGVKLLITSRERMKLSAEWIYDVHGMKYPGVGTEPADLQSDLDDDYIDTYSAVRLFLERANRANPGLSLTAEDMAWIVRICQLVHGVPLGIELAAAWVRIMTIEEIAQEINRNLDFLITAEQDRPERHQSLRAVFEHSWKLLSNEEKDAYKKLSLFRGGFHRKATEQIFGTSLPVLAALADRSLIYRNSSGRYNMHELSRRYAEEKLNESANMSQDSRTRHSAYYATYLEEREQKFGTSEQSQAISDILAEMDNIRAFWHWAIDQNRIDNIGRSLEGLHLFYFNLDWVQEGRQVFQEASMHLQAIVDADSKIDPAVSLVYARLLNRQARFAYRLGTHREAKELLDRGLAILEQLAGQGDSGTRAEKATALFYLSVILRGDGEYEAAERLCQESLEYYEKERNLSWIATIENHLGIIAGSQGKYETARKWLEAALEQYQATGDSYGLADTLNDLGNVAIGLGELDEAMRLNQECLMIRQKTNHKWGIGTSLNNLGYISLLQNEFEKARQYIEKSLVIQRDIGDLYQIANSLSNLGQIVYSPCMIIRRLGNTSTKRWVTPRRSARSLFFWRSWQVSRRCTQSNHRQILREPPCFSSSSCNIRRATR
jgi:predicted ATPase/DNA-binding SARP family transcriptional activator